MQGQQPIMERSIDDLVFVGFNSQVVALDRYSGEIAWRWECPQGKSGHVAVLVDGDRLIVSVQGYMYCLDPIFGQQVWTNPLPGMGVGIPSIASARSAVGGAHAAAVAAKQQQDAAAASAAT